MGGKPQKSKRDTRSPSKVKSVVKKDTRSPSKVKSAVKKDTRSPSMKPRPAKKDAKPTTAQIAAIRKKPVAQRTMAEVRMIVPNAVNKLGHTQAQADRYAAGAAQVNKMRAAAKGKAGPVKAGKAGPVKSKPKAGPLKSKPKAKKKSYKSY